MSNETMDLEQLATYLQRDVREITKLASRGHLPGQKVAGQWRFALPEIHRWIESQLFACTEEQLTALERGAEPSSDRELLITTLISEATIAVPLNASTKSSVLRELVVLAEQSWQVYDPAAILEALRQREEHSSTALGWGVALPHPHRPLPNALGESVLALGVTGSGIPFGEAQGGMTDVFFLLLCREHRTHLHVLARLSRLLLRPGFVDSLRESDTPAEAWQLINAAERELLSL